MLFAILLLTGALIYAVVSPRPFVIEHRQRECTFSIRYFCPDARRNKRSRWTRFHWSSTHPSMSILSFYQSYLIICPNTIRLATAMIQFDFAYYWSVRVVTVSTHHISLSLFNYIIVINTVSIHVYLAYYCLTIRKSWMVSLLILNGIAIISSDYH